MRSIPYRREATLKRFALLGAALAVLAACGTAYRPGDERRSCAELQSEITSNEAQIAALTPESNASAEKASLRPSGTLAGLPFAITTPGDAQRIEARSLRRRNSHLIVYASNKDCQHRTN